MEEGRGAWLVRFLMGQDGEEKKAGNIQVALSKLDGRRYGAVFSRGNPE